MPHFKHSIKLDLSSKLRIHVGFDATAGTPRPSDEERIRQLQAQLAARDAKLASLKNQLANAKANAKTAASRRQADTKANAKKIKNLQNQRASLRQKNERLGERLRAHEEQVNELTGVALPPKNARPCGPLQKDDATYLRTADTDAGLLTQKLGLSERDSLLDVGCGPGRVAIGLIRVLGEDVSYRGADVNSRWVEWAQQNITPSHPSYQFTHLDVASARYNPEGSSIEEGFRFPFEDSSFDHICLFSVFTHMLTDDVRAYLKDFTRVLRPGGKVLATAFLEDNVPEVEENPPGYKEKQWGGPLHCVRYERSFFYGLFSEAGLEVDHEDPEKTFQRHLYASKA